ncbi:O-antigen polymerase [Cecembia calidifontis]|uniref:Oligosaccharide repeat unit polymerase n=1 Tax=Cecembia calidifontis TaxID=1187080 RepID=A0A4Q7PAQ0_9BACT|nr:O-antigen polymerase [Cecembia calidifontis]RZS96698.1 oligosaccharide repeat unit polymerase [Cecembia calidifontis]
MYLIISLFVLVFSFLLFQKASGTLSPLRLNMISWIFYFELIIQYFISSLFVIYEIDEHYLIGKVYDSTARSLGYWAIMYTMIFFPLGMVLANFVWKAKPKELFDRYVKKEIKPFYSKKDSFLRLPLYFLTLISVSAVLYTFYIMKEIPLFSMFSGNSTVDLAIAREEAGRGFQGNFFIRNVFGITLTPILSYIAFSYYKMTKGKFDFFWFLILFVFSILIVTYNISKAPIVLYFLGFIFFRVLEKGKVNKMVLILGVSGILVLLLIFYSFLSTTELNLLFGLRFGIPGRILFSQSAAVYLTFDTFPNFHEYLGISSFSDYVSVFGIQPSERSSRLLMERYFSSRVEEGTAGVLNTLFIAESFANFGWLGLALAPSYVGFLIQTMYVFFLKSRKTPVFLGLFAYFSYKGGVSGGFNEYIYNSGLLILIGVISILFLNASYFKTFFSKKVTRTLKVPNN